MSIKVAGYIRGLSQEYTDGVERQEILINKKDADSLPHKDKMRIPIKLNIGSESFDAGIRSTKDTEYVWICPNMRDSRNKKISLAHVLGKNGFSKNQKVVLEVNGENIYISPDTLKNE
jgi:hypothetical protein